MTNSINLSRLSNLKIPEDPRNAKHQLELITKVIKSFEAKLDNDHEVALKLTSFGQTILLYVSKISSLGPSLIVYSGTIDDQFAGIVQHVSQINFLLLAVPKAEPSLPARRIGFGQE